MDNSQTPMLTINSRKWWPQMNRDISPEK